MKEINKLTITKLPTLDYNSPIDDIDYTQLEFELNEEENSVLEDLGKYEKELKGLNNKNTSIDIFEVVKKSALDSINQVFDMSDVGDSRPDQGGIITTPHNFKKGVVANETDQMRYDNFQKRKEYNRSEIANTRSKVNEIKEEVRKTGYVHDGYTGKKITNCTLIDEYDYKTAPDHIKEAKGNNYRHADAEHVIPAKEFSQNASLNLYVSDDYVKASQEISNLCNDDRNLVATSYDLNRSKGAKNLLEWAKETNVNDHSKTNAEYYDMDSKLMNHAYNHAIRGRQMELIKMAVKKDGKTFAKKTLSTSASYVGKQLIADVIKMTLGEFIAEFKDRSIEVGQGLWYRLHRIFDNLKVKIKNALKSTIPNFSKTIIGELGNTIVNFFFTTCNKAFKIIRSMFSSIIKAIKIIIQPDRPWEERLFEASKIIGAGLVAALGFALNEIIEKAIISILPPLAPLAPHIADILSGLISGIGSALVLALFDKYKDKIVLKDKKSTLQCVICEKNGQLADISTKKALISSARANFNMLQTANIFTNQVAYMAIKKEEINTQFSNFQNRLDRISKLEEERLRPSIEYTTAIDDLANMSFD